MQITPHVRNKWDKLKTVLLGTTHLPEFFDPIKNAKIREPLKVIAEEKLNSDSYKSLEKYINSWEKITSKFERIVG